MLTIAALLPGRIMRRAPPGPVKHRVEMYRVDVPPGLRRHLGDAIRMCDAALFDQDVTVPNAFSAVSKLAASPRDEHVGFGDDRLPAGRHDLLFQCQKPLGAARDQHDLGRFPPALGQSAPQARSMRPRDQRDAAGDIKKSDDSWRATLLRHILPVPTPGSHGMLFGIMRCPPYSTRGNHVASPARTRARPERRAGSARTE